MIFRFEDPLFLLLLGAIPVLAWWYVVRGRRNRGSLTHPDVPGLGRADRRKGRWLQHLPAGLRGLALVAFIVAFARPQTGVTGENVVTEGIDIVLALDISSSMLAEDLAPNRIEAAKAVAADFAAGRSNDRIGLVIFAGKAFTQAPLTLDYSVVVLLTDGRNNRGEIDPVTAAQAAQALGVRVYTIGAGSRGTARVPVPDRFGGTRYVTTRVDVDEPTLRAVAETTGGRYYRATDRESLEAIYREIDELETTEIEVENFTTYGERFHIPLLVGLFLLLAEVVLGRTLLRTLP